MEENLKTTAVIKPSAGTATKVTAAVFDTGRVVHPPFALHWATNLPKCDSRWTAMMREFLKSTLCAFATVDMREAA